MIIFSAWVIHRITNPKKSDKSQTPLSYWLFFFVSVYSSQGTYYHMNCTHYFDYCIVHIICWTCAGVYLKNSTFPFRLMWGVSFFGIFITCNYYTAMYTSMISTPTFKPSVNSIEELTNSKTVKALIVKGSTTEEVFLVKFRNKTRLSLSLKSISIIYNVSAVSRPNTKENWRPAQIVSREKNHRYLYR